MLKTRQKFYGLIIKILNIKSQTSTREAIVVSVTGFQIVTSFLEAIIMVSSSSVDSCSRKAESLVSSSFTSRSLKKNYTSKDKVTCREHVYKLKGLNAI